MVTDEHRSRRVLSRVVRSATILAAAFAAIAVPLQASNALAAAAYPPAGCATLSVSTTAPRPGATITTAGANLQPNTGVRLELHPSGRVLATATTDGTGSFSTNVTLPDGVTGRHDLVAVTAAPRVPGCSPVVTIDIGLGGATATDDGTSAGGTAVTGTDVLAMIIGAVALVGAGLAFNRSGRRRQPR